MDDDSEGVVVISSSPEPEDFRSVRADKGKGRATNGDLLELTSDSDLDLGSVLFRATASGALGRNNAPGPSNQNIQPIASGSGTNVEIPVIEDPIEAAMIQVLDVIPNVDSDHLRTLVVTFHSQGHEDVGTAIISQLLENPDYPKSTIKRKVTEDAQSPSKRTKVDYLAPDRNGITDIGYINLSLDHLLRVDFPTIPKDYVKRTFFGAKSLYAPTYIQLKEDLEDGTKFMCNKATQRADTPRRKGKSKSKAKAKVPAENKDFERERRWLLQYLDDKAELDECERDGTGVECGCCFGDYPFSWMIQCPDAHLFCRDCARRSAEECIGNRKTELVCMDQSGCKLLFAESEVERFLSGGSLALWHRIKQERELELAQIDGLESCPFCSYAVVIENEQERLFRCEGSTCGIVSCRTCKKEDHLPKSCEEAEKDKALDARHTVEEAMTKAMMRSCPKCNQNFVKDYGCNKMVCPNCQSLSCYACRKLIRGYDHFEQNHPGAPAKKGSSSKVKQAAEAAQEELRRLHPELAEGDLAVDLPVAQAPAAPAPAPVLAPRAPPALPNPLAMPGAYPHGFNPRGLNLQDVMRRQREQMQQAQRLLADQNAVIAQEAARLRQAILGQLPVAPPARAPAPARRRRR